MAFRLLVQKPRQFLEADAVHIMHRYLAIAFECNHIADGQAVPLKILRTGEVEHTENKKAELFSKVRSGQVRVLLGSTAKMGAGTNVQTLLVAVHHLDVGWRPSDMTQRNGRIIRQGNQNKQVYVYNYVTESTFDAYLYVRHEVA